MGFPVFKRTALLLTVFLSVVLVARSQPVGESRQLRTVLIDPGHGGHDPGAISAEVREKDLVLSVALRLGNKIKNSYPDVRVIYTRSKDIFIPLHERAAKAIQNKADVFISIHANYVADTRVRGTETFTLGLHRSQENLEVAKKENSVILMEEDYTANYEGFDPKETESYIMFENMQSEYQSQSIALAANIQEAFTKNIGLNNRGVKQAGFLVLRQTSMPSVLVEIGFISHPAERKFLSSETGREKISESIFQAFSVYKKTIDQRSRFELASTDQTSTSAAGTENRKPELTEETVLPPDTNTKKPVIPSATAPKQPIDTASEQQLPAPEQTVKKESANISGEQVATITGKSNSGTKSGYSTGSGDPGFREVFYAVQIGAGKTPIDPVPANFKGEKSIFRVKVEPYFKYYSGKFVSPEEAFAEKSRLKTQYPDAFVVIFENSVPRLFKK